MQVMQHWCESEAVRYFESGGTIAPVPHQIKSVGAVLAEARMEALAPLLDGEVLVDWLDRLLAPFGSRQQLLRRLKIRGVAALSDRQAVVNALSRAWRAARVPLPLPPLSPKPPPLEEPLPSSTPSSSTSPIELWHVAMAILFDRAATEQ